MKKRSISRLIPALALALMMMLCALLPAAAYAAGVALDLVIVIDNSNSNYKGSREQSDPTGYRWDAAAIMLNMCEATDTRAAVIHFANNPKVVPSAWKVDPTAPVSIALTGGVREYYIDDLNGMHLHNTGNGNTYLGKAMLEAVRLLDAGAADRGDRQPVILVLADGMYNAEDEANLLEARSLCEERGYKIYTILLTSPTNRDKPTQTQLNNFYSLSSMTGGGETKRISDASELPAYFTGIFADQIQAEVVYAAPVETKNADGSYTLSFRIPNRSVEEVNILLPMEGLSDPWMYYPNGKLATQDRKTLFQLDTSDRFHFYKIIRPTSPDHLGLWTLRYHKESEDVATPSVSIVYSYNIELQAAMTAPAALTKSTPVSFEAEFLDTTTAQPSTDEYLYRGVSAGDEDAIRVYACLVPRGQSYVAADSPRLELTPDIYARKFTGHFSLKDFGVSASGEYDVILMAQGDGLIRYSAPLAFTVENAAPVCGSLPSPALVIEDPNAQSLDAQDSVTLSFADYITDADQDPMTMTVVSSNPQVVAVDAVSGMDASFKTVGSVGAADITVTVDDGDRNGRQSFTFTVSVSSILDDLTACYAPGFRVITDPGADGIFEKGEAVEMNLIIEQTGIPTVNLDDYPLQMRLFWVGKDPNMPSAEEELTLSEKAPNVWTASFVLPDDRDASTLRADLHAGTLGVKLGQAEQILSTGNAAPVPVNAALSASADIEPKVISIGGKILFAQEGTEPWEVRFDGLFTDANPYDTLTYQIDAGNAAGVMTLEEIVEDGALAGVRIVPAAEGVGSFAIIASDNVGAASAPVTYQLTVTSLTRVFDETATRIGLIILAVLVVLFLLYLIIRPKFAGEKLLIIADGATQDEKLLSASSGTKTTLRRYMPGNCEVRFGVKPAQLDQLQISPAWFSGNGRRVTVKIRSAKALRGLTVKVGTRVLKKGKAVLNSNASLQVFNGTHTIDWKLLAAPPKGMRKATPKRAANPRAAGRPTSNRTGRPPLH